MFFILVVKYNYIYHIFKALVKVPRQRNKISMECFLYHLLKASYILKLLNNLILIVIQNLIIELKKAAKFNVYLKGVGIHYT